MCGKAEKHFCVVTGQLQCWKAAGRLQNLDSLRLTRGSRDSQRERRMCLCIMMAGSDSEGDPLGLEFPYMSGIAVIDASKVCSSCFFLLMSLGGACEGFK